MGVIHLAQVDLTNKFRELGYHNQKKTTISTADILKILKEHYPEIAVKFPNLKSGDMAKVVVALGFPLRTETRFKELVLNNSSDVYRKSKPMTNKQKKLLKYLKDIGAIDKSEAKLTDKLLADVISTKFKPLMKKFANPTFKDAGNILQSLHELEKVKAQEYNKTVPVGKKSVVKTSKGVDVTSKEFLATWEWKTLRYEVLVEQGARCKCCGATAADGIVINVDHIKPRRTHPELALVKSNLQVLCSDCNMGKGNWDQTPW